MIKKNILLFLISSIVVTLGCFDKKIDEPMTLPFYNQADFTPEWIDDNDPSYGQIHKIDEFQFINQNGETIENDNFYGKIYVANFFFTVCPSICPKMTSNMDMVHDQFRNETDVMLLSHSVMPWVDSVQVLKKYAVDRGIDAENWHFVTGDVDEIYALARNSYFAEKEIGIAKDPEEFLHTENFILVDQLGRIRGVYNGTLELEVTRLIEDIKTLRQFG